MSYLIGKSIQITLTFQTLMEASFLANIGSKYPSEMITLIKKHNSTWVRKLRKCLETKRTECVIA